MTKRGLALPKYRRGLMAAVLVAAATAAAIAVALAAHPARADTAPTAITVDGQSPGRTLAGFGAISGGGGTSRLLVDYPRLQRDQILDYLFKPGYGASLQILKVEIGSDSNSTNGAEPSHERTPGAVDCNRGYEWWLMEQAQRRNPHMQFYGLEWGAPGWFDGGFWSQDNISYLLNWLGCARKHHLNIDYLGGWNERGYDMTWYEELKSALVAHGYGNVKVVAADNAGWQVATDMKTNPAFNSATDVIGVHYPCSILDCSSSADAISLNKPIFASESGWNNYVTGADRLATELNNEYIDSKITGFINWPAAYAWYPTIQLAGAGLLRANEPWSGHYELGPTLWTLAQTTQFTRPGWQYLDSGDGQLAGGGTYVSLRSPTGHDYSTVLETVGATAPQTVRFDVTGGLRPQTLHVYSTQLDNGSAATWFTRQPDVRPDGAGTYTLTLQPGYVYTISTLLGHRGTAQSPPSRPLALPYTDTFDHEPMGTSPRYFSDMEGAFQTARCPQAQGALAPGGSARADRGRPPHGGPANTCLRQVITTEPIKWARVPSPVTLVGDPTWTDYTVSTRAMLEQPGTVSLMGRVTGELNSNKPPHVNLWTGYYLDVSDTGDWSLQVVQTNGTTDTLASGTLPAPFGTDRWHRLAISFNGEQITPAIDGTPLTSVSDGSFSSGQVGLMLGSYINADFGDFEVR